MRSSILVLATLVSACSVPCNTPTALQQAGATVQGQVQSPAGWNGSAATPAAAANVALADADGTPVDGLFQQRTATDGSFSISGVPTGYSYVVQARFTKADGTEVTLSSLVTPQNNGGTVQVDLATTLATMLATNGATGLVGQVDSATFQQVVTSLQQKLAGETTPKDPTTALQEAKDWTSQDATLSSDVTKLHQEAATPQGDASSRTTQISQSSDHDPLDALSPVY